MRAAAVVAVRSLVTFIFVAAFFSLGIRIYLDRAWEPVTAHNHVKELPGPVERLQTAEHMERIEAAVEVYGVRLGEYPESLQEVVDAGLLSPWALTYPSYSTSYYYHRSGESYVLHPPRY